MPKHELTVDLADRSYPIYIKSGSLSSLDIWQSLVGGRQVLVVTNETVAELMLDRLLQCWKSLTPRPKKLECLQLKDGEKFKTLETLNLIFDALLEYKYDRRSLIIAFGGGVIGDMAGFAAACYQRGVEFVQVPTTLLSQVDSSVGGKTGVNHPLGKNMIGAFYQPLAVVIDTEVLQSLPARELSAGLAEVIKYGLIADAKFFDWLEQNMDLLRSLDAPALAYAIRRSCEIKAEVVSKDERESGLRAILNLGHTFGHAIENVQGYGSWLHGEAVGAGMLMACELSLRLGWIDDADYSRAFALIERAGLPTAPPANMTREDFIAGMSVDKKVLDGQLRLVLLERIGKAVVTSDFDHSCLDDQLKQLMGRV
jgi:3-dehydroquinate synthase